MDDFQHSVPTGVVLTKARHTGRAVTHPAPVGGRHRLEHMRVRLDGDTAMVVGVVLSTDAGGSDARPIFADGLNAGGRRWRTGQQRPDHAHLASRAVPCQAD